MQSTDEDVPLGRIIYCTAQDMYNVGEKILKPFDVTLEQMHLMKCLTITNGSTQKKLGDMISKSPANTTRLLDRLEAKGLVERQRCPNDRRAILVYITATGRDVHKEGKKLLELFTLDTFKGITKEELVAIRKFFSKVQINIEDLNHKFEEQ